ncbi:response regulator transcription factor [Desulfobacterales bacterium HSG16]|nr:response regulator transcription factor [Desulfobacterales bacterium HSG16]
MSIRIILADDHKIIRDGLRSLIENQMGMEVIAEAKDGRTAVALTRRHQPDIVIMDISMPGLNGIEATRQITSESLSFKVIALSMHTDRRFVQDMFKAGVSGYLLKDCAFEELNRAIISVMSGQTYLSPMIASVVIDDYVLQVPENKDKKFHLLSGREREVTQMIAEGNTTKQIALALHVSVKTIETHRRNIMGKLNLHSIAELTKYALKEGLTF